MEVLRQVYADHSTKVDNVFSRILETTEHPAAAASLASIMCAPQGQLSFWEALSGWVVSTINLLHTLYVYAILIFCSKSKSYVYFYV